ncbi:MAG: hypothetical protein EBU20_09265 [Betaproteobacteria bacterium]|nr:hypothetical protein [Betaproteobacteria bacterium]
MFKISSRQGDMRATCHALWSVSASTIMFAGQGIFVPSALAQAVQEVIITGNPLSKSQSTNTVSSLSGQSLLQQGQSTLGETLNQLPGVSSTYFGPNASRR